MPNIRTYDAGDIGLRPTETRIEARAGTARRIGAFSNQVAGATEMLARSTEQLGRETESLGSYVSEAGHQSARAIASTIETAGRQAEKIADHQQIVAGAPAFAKLMQAKEDQWNATAKGADPNDPTTGKKFLDGNLEPDLQKFSEGFYTEGARHWAESQVNAFRQHMYAKTAADMSTAAGQAAVVGQHQTINSLSATVRSDPSSLDFSLATLDHATEGVLSTSPNLSAADAARARGAILQKGKEEIIKSAALGHIEKTGQVPSWATDPKYAPYVNGAELKTVEGYAKAQQRFAQSEARAARLEAKQNAQADFNKRFNDRIGELVTDQGIAAPTAEWWRKVKEDMKTDGAQLEPGRVEQLVNWGNARLRQAEQEKKTVTDQDVYRGLTQRLFDPINPTTLQEVIKADAEGKLGDKEFTKLKENIRLLDEKPLKTPQFHEATKAVEQALTYQLPGMPGKDPKGSAAYSAFINDFLPKYLALDRAGQLPASALDVKDPQSLISQAMAPYKRSTSQKLQDWISEVGGEGVSPTGAGRRCAQRRLQGRLGRAAAWHERQGHRMDAEARPVPQ
jgi:hypothetical protein